jgi:hypothetical protein
MCRVKALPLRSKRYTQAIADTVATTAYSINSRMLSRVICSNIFVFGYNSGDKDTNKRGKFQIFLLLLHSGMTEVANTTTYYLSPGSICWAAFLAMGARLENSPNNLFLLDYYAV